MYDFEQKVLNCIFFTFFSLWSEDNNISFNFSKRLWEWYTGKQKHCEQVKSLIKVWHGSYPISLKFSSKYNFKLKI